MRLSTAASRKGVIVLPALALAVSVSCAAGPAASTDGSVASVGASSAAGGAPASAPSTTVPAKGGAPRTLAAMVGTLRVERERPAGYKRSLFRHWTDDDGNGCSAREDVLIAETRGKAQVDAYGCKVVAGDWYSPYDGAVHTDPSEVDIDHVVALKEAWDSGAHSWSASKRRQFANDLTDARTLIAVTDNVNQAKGDKDPSNWMPPLRSYWCTYLADWVAIKVKWGLSVDQSEAGRIRNIANSECAGTTIAAWGSSTATTVPGTSVTTAPPAGVAPVSTTVPSAATSTPGTPAGSGVRTVKPGAFCTPRGAAGAYNGIAYVCETSNADGQPYKDGRARWRKAG